MKEQTYTQEEVLKNINIFKQKEDDLINQRKELNKHYSMLENKKSIGKV